jgi:flagellar biosynthesis anti-sigma factor FlgM
MTGMDGINSLHKMLGALQVNESKDVSSAAATRGSTNPGSIASTAASASVDHASLSAAGGLAADLSDVRTTKVAELRQAISNGTYNVPASAVASKMVESMLG